MEEDISNSETSSKDSKVLNLIPIQIVDYQNFKESRKYYRQTYRPAWEKMPDFAGWLKGVEKEPTRAFCIYCEKTLHAHRLSLLKHTCTVRHQKAAQMYLMRKKSVLKAPHEKAEENDEDDIEQDNNEIVDFTEETTMEDDENDEEQFTEYQEEQLEEDDEETELQFIQTEPTKEVSSNVAPISTQVTDIAKGAPVSGLPVSLYKLLDGRWTYMNEGYTNHKGIFSKFFEGLNFTPGRYKLHYDVDRYFESQKQESLYPFIEIVFDHKGTNGGGSYHFPLTLSPHGYSTYKGC